jgi:hypothetical protein
LPKKIPKAASDNEDAADGHSFPTIAKKPPPDMAEVKRALADVVRDLREVSAHRTSDKTARQSFPKRRDLNCVELLLVAVESIAAT